jgi:hypothetical protein
MEPNQILSRSKKILTNKFTGMDLMSGAQAPNLLEQQFQVVIKNPYETKKNFALFPAFFDTSGLIKARVRDHDNAEGSENLPDDNAGINPPPGGLVRGRLKIANFFGDQLTDAGYPTDYVIDDTQGKGYGESVPEMYSMTPGCSINSLLRYVKTNVLWVQRLMVISRDISTFTSFLQFARVDPRSRAAINSTGLDAYMVPDQFKSDRILWDFKDSPLRIADDSLIIATLSGRADATFLFTFRAPLEEAKTTIVDEMGRARLLGF